MKVHSEKVRRKETQKTTRAFRNKNLILVCVVKMRIA